MKKLVLAAIMILGFFATAVAGDNFNRCFYSMDKNGDDTVSTEEFRTALPNSAAAFKEADSDKSGTLDHDEWEAFKESKGIEDHHHG
ncbi:hypothetical protein [Desulfovibrio sp. JC010]|uniref:hypothetical protein n=1 Tax=Desulfovibrio sp. JC010 TaxID=2593641 RepID=UPI0013D44F68|nr:hypothetical protein [Desulfovibrio sp. JC010]NDV26003.1 hypothetical protein [Desulfovibrio sp. JC010]